MSDELLLCEQVLLIAYDARKGHAGLTSPAAAISGAVVLDLVLAGSLIEQDGKLTAAGSGPAHPALAGMFGAVARSARPRKVGHWVSTYAKSSRTQRMVAAGLADKGILRAERRRFLGLIPTTRYPQADGLPEKRLRERLDAILLHDAEPSDREALLVGVLRAGKLLDNVVPKDRRKQAAARAEQVAEKGKTVNAAVAKAILDVELAITAGAVAAASVAATSGGC